MNYAFEKEKNIKATAITAVITIILFSIFFYVQYTQPQTPEPITGEGIEVNLGNSETGLGDIAPQAKSDLAPEANNTRAVTPPSAPNNIQETTSSNEDDIAVNKSKTAKKPTVEKEIVKAIPIPKPKAVFSGPQSIGSGGNNSDSYNGIRNQGITGGKGDQGNPNGNPNSDSYTGNASSGSGGNGGTGVSIRTGLDGRRITKLPAFEDDFNENAKVAVDITVDQVGVVTGASINPKGTTTTNTTIRAIALRKARLLKLNAGTSEAQTGTLVFSFRLRN